MRKPKSLVLILLGSVLLCQPVLAARFNPFGLFAPASPPTLNEGVKAFERGDFNGAISALETYAKQYPGDSDSYYWLAKCYEMTVQPTKTGEALQTYRDTKEQEGLIFSFAKAPDSSKLYAVQVKSEPNRAKCRALYAIALMHEKDTFSAQAEAERLLLLPDTDTNKYIRQPMLVILADVYTQKKRFADAKAMIQEAMTIRGNGVLLRQRLDSIQAQQEEYVNPDTEKQLETQFNEMYKLAKDLMIENNLRGAMDAIKQAMDLKPDHAGARNLKISVCRLLSRDLYQEAKGLLEKANNEGAMTSLQQAVEMDPENTAAQDLLKKLQEAPATASVEASGSTLPAVPNAEGSRPE